MPREHATRVVRILDHSADTRSLFLTQPDPPLCFLPGQFVSCLVPSGAQTLNKPYTIASDPEAPELELCFRMVPSGSGSTYLYARTVGDTLRVTGPWGTFTLAHAPADESVFVAHSTGIAAIRPMLRRALATSAGARIALLYAPVAGEAALFTEELRGLAARHPQLHCDQLPDGTLGEVVQQRYVEHDTQRERQFFICGIGDIVTHLRDLLRSAGYQRGAVHYEKW